MLPLAPAAGILRAKYASARHIAVVCGFVAERDSLTTVLRLAAAGE